jgi:hypothetical protein
MAGRFSVSQIQFAPEWQDAKRKLSQVQPVSPDWQAEPSAFVQLMPVYDAVQLPLFGSKHAASLW